MISDDELVTNGCIQSRRSNAAEYVQLAVDNTDYIYQLAEVITIRRTKEM